MNNELLSSNNELENNNITIDNNENRDIDLHEAINRNDLEQAMKLINKDSLIIKNTDCVVQYIKRLNKKEQNLASIIVINAIISSITIYSHEQENIINTLLKLTIDSNNVNHKTECGNTLLAWAIKNGALVIAAMLIKHGASLKEVSINNNNQWQDILDTAQVHDNIAIVKYLWIHRNVADELSTVQPRQNSLNSIENIADNNIIVEEDRNNDAASIWKNRFDSLIINSSVKNFDPCQRMSINEFNSQMKTFFNNAGKARKWITTVNFQKPFESQSQTIKP